MKKFKVTIDSDEVIENVQGWSAPGGKTLLLDFPDGSSRLLTGWIDVSIEAVVTDGTA